MRIGMEIIKSLTGSLPLGWYTGRDSPNTRRLVVEHGGLLYDSDYYGDDLPFWTEVALGNGEQAHTVVPYTLDTNDMRFATAQGFNTGEQFYQYLKDAFDVLYAEGDPAGLDRPKMLSVGMHCRLLGRPAASARCNASSTTCRATTRSGSAAASTLPATGPSTIPTLPPSKHEPDLYPEAVEHDARGGVHRRAGGIYEHSPWVARGVAARRPFANAAELADAMRAEVDAAGDAAQIRPVRAHPELAGKAAVRGELTAESTREQSGAGLDRCSPEEFARLQALNQRYNEKFGFPFILAVRGYDRAGIIVLRRARGKRAGGRVANLHQPDPPHCTVPLERLSIRLNQKTHPASASQKNEQGSRRIPIRCHPGGRIRRRTLLGPAHTERSETGSTTEVFTMQKQFTPALAGSLGRSPFSGTAMAQSSVTLYGRRHVRRRRQEPRLDQPRLGRQPGGMQTSYWGIKGTEDRAPAPRPSST